MALKTFVLIHQHTPAQCSIAYAAWSGFASPLRGRTVHSTCARYRSSPRPGAAASPLMHETWWTTEAEDGHAALIQLPAYVRDRTQAREVSELTIT
jgi:hypothetical protein